jgi:quinol monooxygenase YgiN
VRPENSLEFEAALAEMVSNVRTHEPDAIQYEVFKSVDDCDTYVVIEIYRNQAAIENHRTTDYLRTSIAKTAALVDGQKFEIKRYASPGTR